ncbi:hypothetical protein FRB98_007679 [Tulasnella sp. 332]|nr:hypothetical protein FRB98_007679 [Tulasnella sp. 332]
MDPNHISISTTPGPEIDGQPSIISFLTPEQLNNYPYLSSLRQLINAAFKFNHGGHATNNLFPADVERLRSDLQICGELGPDSFTYIVSAPTPNGGGTPRLYASASGRHVRPEGYKIGPFKDAPVQPRQVPLDLEKFDAWELKLLVVDPTLHKQGLGSLMTKLVEVEAVKRSAEKTLQRSKTESTAACETVSDHLNGQAEVSKNKAAVDKKVILTLSAAREVNETYYLRRGFVTTEIKTLPKGFGNTSRDWDLCFMQREIVI